MTGGAAGVARGGLFSRDFLAEAICRTPEWLSIADTELDVAAVALQAIFERFLADEAPDESRTRDHLIRPVLRRLGWVDRPDGVIFADAAGAPAEAGRLDGHGPALVEWTRWRQPLDRSADGDGPEAGRATPAARMLRALGRLATPTGPSLRWGILTNGARWRLYFQGAGSVLEDFCELDFAALLGFGGGAVAPTEADRRHGLRMFLVIFGRGAFMPSGPSATTLHQRALEHGRLSEQRVAAAISSRVYDRIFPGSVRAIAAAAPDATPGEVRDSALVLLYRLLFLCYAEDRQLLPMADRRYEARSLRRLRDDIGCRKDRNEPLSAAAWHYWDAFCDLTCAIGQGDAALGLPPCGGGLFEAARAPLLTRIRLADDLMADIIDALSVEQTAGRRRPIDYRDLSVQQLGAIYERLIECAVVREDDGAVVRLDVFARKNSGSYYTPDPLVRLIARETLGPLIAERIAAFQALAADPRPIERRADRMAGLDPALALLDLKICDPAMGSGHFLVAVVDHLADRVVAAMAEAEIEVEGRVYRSPLAARIDRIRSEILADARRNGWTIDPDQLGDRHIVRRLVLQRCIHGVDKNPMAVELAKTALWLHGFTVGAPLPLLDHHLRTGDALFGGWVGETLGAVARRGGDPVLLRRSIAAAIGSTAALRRIDALLDAREAAPIFRAVQIRTAPLDRFMAVLQALEWLEPLGAADRRAIRSWLGGAFGDPVDVLAGTAAWPTEPGEGARIAAVFRIASDLVAEQRFCNWQVSFPEVWADWPEGRQGGFDAVVGNPPWDRMKLQQVEWFATRRAEIARAPRAADRARMIAALDAAGDPLALDFAHAAARAETALRVARASGDYPLLSGGDVNLYSLFVERAMALVRPEGMVGLLTPSGIASDKNAARFFRAVATGGRLKALYDFENKKVFFPEVHASFKFSILIASPQRRFEAAHCAFHLHSVAELGDPERCFPLGAADFARVNPNTGTAPVFRTRRDADLTAAIYRRLPVLVDRSGAAPVESWPVKYRRMFDMTNDSHLFVTRRRLETEFGAAPIGGNRWRSAEGDWVPLYEGKMVQPYDHRAASIGINPRNLNRPAQPIGATLRQHQDPAWLPTPQYWVSAAALPDSGGKWFVGIKDVTAPTNRRTMIAAAIPRSGAGNTLPILLQEIDTALLVLANLNALVFDFCTRQKIQGQHLNWYIVEQLPFVPPGLYGSRRFGDKMAGDLVREAVLELTYTAHDMADFARDLGHVSADGTVLPPFAWDERRRVMLRAKLDAAYFLLYGITDPADIRYIYSTFPIVERDERREHGRFLSCDLCLAWLNALLAGDTDAEVRLGGGEVIGGASG